MVEVAQDIHRNLKQLIVGAKIKPWLKLENQLNLIDLQVIGEFTWQKYGVDQWG